MSVRMYCPAGAKITLAFAYIRELRSLNLGVFDKTGFPRGLGLVTRCATQVRMKRSKNIGWKGYARVSWAEKQPEGSGELEKPEDVAKAIETLTEALVAKDESAQFSSVSIVIDIEAATVPDLTLIDLPGMYVSFAFPM